MNQSAIASRYIASLASTWNVKREHASLRSRSSVAPTLKKSTRRSAATRERAAAVGASNPPTRAKTCRRTSASASRAASSGVLALACTSSSRRPTSRAV